MKLRTIIISLVALLVVVGAVSAITLTSDELKELMGNHKEAVLGSDYSLTSEPFDLVGSRTGTSTTPVYFVDPTSATSTYPLRIGQDTDMAIFTINATLASTTPTGSLPLAYFSILKSNDYDCDTATTTTIYNVPTKSQITWTDAGHHIRNASAVSSFSSKATTTIAWTNIAPGYNNDLILDGLNTECLALQIQASSTAFWVQTRLKD